MSKPTILLTGANGFLGSHLLEALLKEGYELVVLKRSTSDLWRINHLSNQYKSYDVDTQPLDLAFKEQKIDCVIHTACHYGRNGDSIHSIVQSNLLYGIQVLEAAIACNVKTFINTDSLLPRELNLYSLSKKQLVDWLKHQSDHIQVVNLRLEHMFGPKDDATKFVSWVITQLKANAPEIKLTQGEQQRDFIYIDDVVNAYLTVLSKLAVLPNYSEFDVGSGVLTTVRSFLEQMKDACEVSFGKVETQLLFGALPYRDGEMMSVDLNTQGLRDLGWSAKTDIGHGLTYILKENA
jgi:nucleoside-diphosphate-sugar epimerase